MSYDPGDVWNPELTVRDAGGELTAATVTLTVTDPAGAVTSPSVTTPSLGVYRALIPLDAAGQWLAVWAVSGAVTGVESQVASVRPLGSVVVSIADVKARLNKTLTVDDLELSQMIDAALAEYGEWVGPVGTKTLRYDGGGVRLILPVNVSAVTAVTYTDGTAVDVADLEFDAETGLLGWGYNTAGAFTYGARNVEVTMTVALPAHHREAIIADVAGYFAATQRGGGSQSRRFPGEGYAEAYEAPGTPVTLFPRIRALAAAYPAIA